MSKLFAIIKIKQLFIDDSINRIIYTNENIKYYNSYVGDYFMFDSNYLRKLKLQNLNDTILEDDKKLLEFLINTNLVLLLNENDLEIWIRKHLRIHGTGGISSSCGVSGTSGWSGPSGLSGITFNSSSVSGITNITDKFNFIQKIFFNLNKFKLTLIRWYNNLKKYLNKNDIN